MIKIQLFYLKISLFCLLLLWPRLNSAEPLTCYIKPTQINKGSAVLLLFDNLKKNKRYFLHVFYHSREKIYDLAWYQDLAIKWIPLPLDCTNNLIILLKENNKEIFQHTLVPQKKDYGLKHIQIDEQYVFPDESLKERIYQDQVQINKCKKVILPEIFFLEKPLFPVKNGLPGTGYGYNRIFNQKQYNIHKGLDISAEKGTPVQSILKGKVILTGDFYYTGNTVFINHGDNLISLYAHLDTIKTETGQVVKKGEKIGTVGSTGRSTGPHLHLGIYINNEAVDPMSIYDILDFELYK